MNIDFSQLKTAEQLQADKERAQLDGILATRRAAYLSESDPLRLEADYDGLRQGNAPDYTAWLGSVVDIKKRFPLPKAVVPAED
ncbi:hypothetical protein [Pseudomonas weihenstephanensis]|uniref:hypothetical protein n=1 Tax=Pseudomonas weihenstephanensis TaxID=1608994 RepID=UPI000654B6B8|nr:hypothetical protein [Pseudomonas weihenstephanensis]KMN16848.1 hypothetical protein TU87_19635 [Pseudomonas weihenstephanensis]MBM1193311.1 hypothetical protein [Pseudomonas weihenstephanensis]